MLEVMRFYKGAFEKAGSFQEENGQVVFRYDDAYLRRATSHALSCSLPLRDQAFQHYEYQGFFEGLVPEGRTRIELAHRMGISPSNWLSLLEQLNCECIGALMFKQPHVALDSYTPSYTPYPVDLFDQLVEAPSLVAAKVAESSRLSLSGAQAKVGLAHTGSDPFTHWFMPQGTAPSTHIVKVPDENHPDLAANEFICMEAARRCGLDVAECFIIPAKRPLFAVHRFDRIISENSLCANGVPLATRLHQEDFCQAAGLPSYGKYEMEATDNYVALVNKTIERFSSDTIRDKTEFARQTMFNYLVGNCDNHLKNYSLAYSADWNSRSLAPAYDIVSTTILGYSRLMGISIGDTRDIDQIGHEDWMLFAEDLRMPKDIVLDLLDELREQAPHALMQAAKEAPVARAQQVAELIARDMEPRLREG